MKSAIVFTSLALACTLAQAAGGKTWKYELLHSFSPSLDGAVPTAGLVEQGGVFWGTTSEGGPGAGAQGTVYKFVPGSKPVVMHTFHGRDGANPKSELLAVGRNLYGTVENGLVSNQGGVYRISTLGAFKVMNAFSVAEGTSPEAPLIRATDGNLYGTTQNDGAHSRGTVFQMTPSGVVTVLHSFQSQSVASSKSPLAQHGDGFLYGTTGGQGQHGEGSVFKISMSGGYTLLHSFLQTDPMGCHPKGITSLADGRLVGVAAHCGNEHAGTAFQVSHGGEVSLLHAFVKGVEGMAPWAELALRSDGVLWGTASIWSTPDHTCGSLFAMTTDGSVGVHHVFNANEGEIDGCEPRGALLTASDGAIYGTTIRGGTFDAGTIFRLRRVSVPPGQ